jgi:hypothetical protein
MTDYLDLQHEDTVETVDGYQLEKYSNARRGRYTLLLRSERFGPVERETTVANREDADQILEASTETPIQEVLEK